MLHPDSAPRHPRPDSPRSLFFSCSPDFLIRFSVILPSVLLSCPPNSRGSQLHPTYRAFPSDEMADRAVSTPPRDRAAVIGDPISRVGVETRPSLSSGSRFSRFSCILAFHFVCGVQFSFCLRVFVATFAYGSRQ